MWAALSAWVVILITGMAAQVKLTCQQRSNHLPHGTVGLVQSPTPSLSYQVVSLSSAFLFGVANRVVP
jgi:hypothetical protein